MTKDWRLETQGHDSNSESRERKFRERAENMVQSPVFIDAAWKNAFAWILSLVEE